MKIKSLWKEFAERDKTHLKSLPKVERKFIKSMKRNYRVAGRIYAWMYANMAKKFEIYIDSLPLDK